MAGAISLTHWISSKMTSRLRARAVAAISRVSMTAPAASTFAMIAKRRRPSDHLAQKLKTLAGRIGLLERQSGEVAARTRQANDDTGADRIHLRGKDDRDNLRGLLGREDRCRGPCDDDIDLELDECGEPRSCVRRHGCP